MSLPRVTVIVPVHNDAARLARCVRALAAQDYPARLREVLVVDNGSTDDPGAAMADLVDAAGVRLLHEPAPGSYAARNRGIEAATGEVLAFTDADCVPEPGWLSAGIARLGPGVGLVGGAVRLFPRQPGRFSLAEAYEAAHGFPQEHYVQDRHFAVTANLLTTAQVMATCGPFDASLRSGGDQEWGQRTERFGLAAVYAPDAVVAHPMRHSLRELASKTRRTLGGMHDRHALDRYMASPFTFWRYIAKHAIAPVKQVPEMRRRAQATGAPFWKLFAATCHRQGVRARELVRLRSGGPSRR
ncbi:MAG TPA: glycosyltransferase [Candidatus Thermoplasmatota archaeon]|nr:glycosyltransferase [Candidatus Thermoplasmatota archaeon]